jgi:hypothetical protein
MNYTFDEDTVSDLHRDAYGFRPGGNFWSAWAAFNADQRQALWDSMMETAERTCELERESQRACEHDFQCRITSLQHLGARDFAMALRWLHDAHDTQGDDEYLEFRLGLSFGYLGKAREAAGVDQRQRPRSCDPSTELYWSI